MKYVLKIILDDSHHQPMRGSQFETTSGSLNLFRTHKDGRASARRRKERTETTKTSKVSKNDARESLRPENVPGHSRHQQQPKTMRRRPNRKLQTIIKHIPLKPGLSEHIQSITIIRPLPKLQAHKIITTPKVETTFDPTCQQLNIHNG